MATSAMPSPLIDIFETEPIAENKMLYLEARARLRLHDFILRYFEMKKDSGLDQATLARRLGMDRGQLSRTLGVSGNWTIRTATRLAAAIGGEIDFNWLPFPANAAIPDEKELQKLASGKEQSSSVLTPKAPQPPRKATPGALGMS